MKVFKPGQLGILTRCFEHGRRFYMGVSALSFIQLGRTDSMLHEVAMWKFVAERLGAEGALDAAIPKSRGEFLVNGSAFAPGGQPVPAIAVRAAVGSLQKDLAVYGDRYWTGRSATQPRPFTQMPLDWAHAFGGQDYAKNPHGKGVSEVEIEGVQIVPLPNIEAPREPISAPGDRPDPAGFGPLDISWPQRNALAGTYDQHWLENLFPGFARDVDWEIHNIACPDQRRDGFWEGGERYRFDNLHPSKVVEGELPRFRARVFVSRSHQVGQPRPPIPETKAKVKVAPEVIDEIPLALQTLWFFPDAEFAVLIWSGSTIIAEEQGEDILHLMAAAEHQGRPRELEHYRQAMAARLDPDNGPIASLRDEELLPQDLGPAPSPLDEDVELAKFGNFAAQNLHRRQVQVANDARAIVAGHGLDPDIHGPLEVPPLPPAPSIQEAAATLEKAKAEAAVTKAELEAKAAKAQADIDKIVDDANIEGFTSETVREEQAGPGHVGPPIWTADFMLGMLQKLAMDSRSAGVINDEIEGMIVNDKLYAEWAESERKQFEAYRIQAHLQSPAPPMPAELTAPTRERVRMAIANGEDFATLNMTGADLSGMDLAGANLSGALLESAILEGTNLSGANLDNAVLAHAKLTGTRFDGASLVNANIGRAKISGAVFTGADLSKATLFEAEVADASFERATLVGVTFFGAQFERVNARGMKTETAVLARTRFSATDFAGAMLDKCILLENDLRGSSFDGASLVGATFLNSDLREVGFRGARLDNARFVEGTKLDGAVFTQASLLGTNLRGMSLRGADLRQASMDRADLTECDLADAKLYQVVAREAKFEVADLRNAELMSGNFMNASFARATLYGADFRGANLHGADMARVRSDATVQLGEALLTKVRIHPRHVEASEPA
ncbi:hypothetical protein DB30_03377 [Enhygromyxa salina]|uniref:DUF2169 domain-containing protein n=1 Tax=Enhygromyxa salina TaxID=215803 RepID=A0A0C2D6Q0_9BACT|nr:DUF2169 domain-containing protein [Enhygromyxa salina]KIG17320.1 hypothetical protein DB30_03377 [Enhygromyxa salina]